MFCSCNMSKRMHEYSFLLLLPKKISAVYLTKVCTQHRVYITRASHNSRSWSYVLRRTIFDKTRFSRLIIVQREKVIFESIELYRTPSLASSFFVNKFLEIEKKEKIRYLCSFEYRWLLFFSSSKREIHCVLRASRLRIRIRDAFTAARLRQKHPATRTYNVIVRRLIR